MSRLYTVKTERFGTLQRADDNIVAARAWARKAFGVGSSCVNAVTKYKWCERCESSPCCCTGGET